MGTNTAAAMQGGLTEDLARSREGDHEATSRMIAAIEPELRRIAAHLMARERRDHTLQATALVGEAYLRLVGGQPISWTDRGHFLYLAADCMRHILVDHARERRTEKRGGKAVKVPLDNLIKVIVTDLEADHVDLDEALAALHRCDPERERILVLFYYIGMTVDEIALSVGLAPRTIDNRLRQGRAQLRLFIEDARSVES